MRIAFDSRPAGDLRGVGRYTRCLLAALRARGVDVRETARPRRARDDTFHSPWIDGAPLRPRVPTVVTLHDLVPLKRRGEYLRTGLRFRRHWAAVRRADAVVVPTRAVAGDAAELLSLDPARLHVVHEAAADVFGRRAPAAVEEVRRRLRLPERYLVWVGGLQTEDPRKRVRALARAPRGLPLVLAGPTGGWTRDLRDVHLTGALSDDDLAAVLTGAHALVLPSDEEGFGLTAVEALACGTPVAASDGPALREVLAGRATLVEPGDVAAVVAAAERIGHEPAPAPLPRTWDAVAAETLAVHSRILAAPDG